MKIFGDPVTPPSTQALPKTGGTMSGDIQMDGNKVTGLGTPTDNADAVTKKYVDDIGTTAKNALPKSGGTMTGPVAMSGNKITGLGTPTEAGDAVNKSYVDSRKQTATAALPVDGWSGNTQTVSVNGVTADNTVIVAPEPASFTDYTEAGVRCTAQSDGALTFVCEDAPSVALAVNVVILA